MIMLYNSDSFTVLQFDLADGPQGDAADGLTQGGFEIVDKQAQTGIWLGGELARSFQAQALELVGKDPDQDTLDAFISGYTGLSAQPMILH